MPTWRVEDKSTKAIIIEEVIGDDARSALYALGIYDDDHLLYDVVKVSDYPLTSVFRICREDPQIPGEVVEVLTTGSRSRAEEERTKIEDSVVVEERSDIANVARARR